MKRAIFRFLISVFLCDLCASAAAAQNTLVTGTFKTEDHKSPSAAGLAILGCIDASVSLPACLGSAPFYGTVVFRSVDSAKRPSGLRCATVTHPPQRVPAYLKGDGTLADSAGAPGVRLVPTAGCSPSGLQYEAEIVLGGAADGRRPEVRLKQYKAIPNQVSVDWSTL